MESLIDLDKYWFKVINSQWNNSFFDLVLPYIRNQFTWGPLYIFLVVFVLVNFKKNAGWWILFFIGTAVLSDFVSSDLIKKNVLRLRPCNDPDMADQLRFLVGYRPKSSSFTSSHATNHFAAAAFLYYTLKNHIGKWAWLFFAWAFVIVYAQIYVGVHYPIDVICGGIIGFILGYLTSKSFNRTYSLV